MTKERHKIVPASYIIFIKDGKVLLQRRCNTGYEDGKYSMVAGHVDKGETFTQAITREAKEEAGIEINANDLRVVHVLNRDSEMAENNERIDIFFMADKWQGEFKIMEPEKCDDLSWFDLDNLPENTIPYIRHVLECVKNKIFYSEFGWEK